jgi:hypothetical protein
VIRRGDPGGARNALRLEAYIRDAGPQGTPKVLADGQAALAGADPGARLRYVFHGGSGSTPEEIREAVPYAVVKMNIDSDIRLRVHVRGCGTRGRPVPSAPMGELPGRASGRRQAVVTAPASRAPR